MELPLNTIQNSITAISCGHWTCAVQLHQITTPRAVLGLAESADTFKALHGLGPNYLKICLHPFDLDPPPMAIIDILLLGDTPLEVRRVTRRDRAFSVVTSRLWIPAQGLQF